MRSRSSSICISRAWTRPRPRARRDDGGIRRVRAGDDRGSRQVRAAPGQAARDQEREADRPPARARAYAGSNPGSLSGRWHRNARPGKALSGQPWHGADTAQPRSLTTQTAPSKSELSVKIKKISETATGEKIFLGIDSGHSGSP